MTTNSRILFGKDFGNAAGTISSPPIAMIYTGLTPILRMRVLILGVARSQQAPIR